MFASDALTIRKPELRADYESISELAERLAKHHGEVLKPDPERLMNDRDWYTISLAAIEGTDVGFVCWHKQYACQSASRGLEVQSIYVAPEYRGNLVAVRLLLEVVHNAFNDNASLGLCVRKDNLKALEFYKKLKFKIIDHNDLWRCRWDRASMQEFATWAEQKLFEQ